MHLQRLIFLRIVALMTLLTLSIGGAFSFFTIERNREMSIRLWQTRSMALAEALERMVLWDDRVGARQLLLSEFKRSDVLLYCFILKEGNPYVYTFEKGIPAQLIEHKPLKSGQDIWEYQDLDGMVIYDIATDIGNAGISLRVGLKRAAIDAKMQQMLLTVLVICLLTLGISCYLALVVSRRTTREVDDLVEALKTYGDLHGDELSLTGSTSEVTDLINSFKQQVARRKEVEEQLAKLNWQLDNLVHERTLQLQATNKELDSFAYSVSHDLRTPLRGIEGFSHALLEDYASSLDDTGKDYIDRIRQGCIKMAKLIDDMLKLSRITRSELCPVPVDLGQLAEQILSDLQRNDPGRTVDFSVETAMPAVVDPTLIRSVMENLLGNAWKFTRNREKAIIRCGTLNKDANTAYYIKDNGAGFNMEYENKLFCAFQRLHRVDEYEGNGIGLASVQRIIIRHGGRVWAEGEEGEGATFYFTLGGTE